MNYQVNQFLAHLVSQTKWIVYTKLFLGSELHKYFFSFILLLSLSQKNILL